MATERWRATLANVIWLDEERERRYEPRTSNDVPRQKTDGEIVVLPRVNLRWLCQFAGRSVEEFERTGTWPGPASSRSVDDGAA